ncbi:porin [Janthinobacterium aquaticum]|uniref:porin n=1 Tax=Janthinobacterium sp. FT58W TaxID=2654254 RepID=UPI001265961F|nr:porin [Janthinobacterium sp. FT58W]KAB8041223.1 porin [Janthinobacterium sp. FT58W]
MKQLTRALALSAGALLCTTNAHAQSKEATGVTVYGLLDVGVETSNNNAVGGGTVTRVSSGGMNTSRFGFRGVEDLGGGLQANFNLEGALSLDTGAGDSALFKRQANVGLQGSFGKVLIGRSFTTVYDFMIGYDPMSYAPYYSWATTGNASNRANGVVNKYGMTTGFDNLVKYAGQAGDFKFGASYGAGEQTTGLADSRKLATAVTWARGPFATTLTWEQINGNVLPATGKRDQARAVHFGLSYAGSGYKLQAAMRAYLQEAARVNTPEVQANLYWAGGSYQATPAITLTSVLYYQDVKNVAPGTDADPAMLVARFRYALSKRTDLYLTGAYARAKHNQRVSLSRDSEGFGDTQHGLMAGMQHRF